MSHCKIRRKRAEEFERNLKKFKKPDVEAINANLIVTCRKRIDREFQAALLRLLNNQFKLIIHDEKLVLKVFYAFFFHLFQFFTIETIEFWPRSQLENNKRTTSFEFFL